MARQVWKQVLDKGANEIQLPQGAVAVSTGYQENRGGFVVYFDVPNTERPLINRVFLVIPTGRRVPRDARYVGTIAKNENSVWHVFEAM